ncbi:SDR family oxidoreductase [Hoyosella subflava]|uniref:NAD(P)H--quinone oxidoreductase n=1 Tax=Hoyosella subflava (strain DSM 45089 / JCM 17490 / NBRC 109087 / DQS3-9A1) TaxID=443218 RepID=F6EMT3_HOYSD|nr:SDR family oxidoreductase [Hoyosella subflava]AEF42825.1 NAD(P)H--quinone oxidoreductase [Hoyosella subflava DQS3-9A1]
MTIAVTGAAGHLGRLAIDALQERGVAAGDIVAIVRDAARAADLSEAGVQVRVADYSDSQALTTALSGVGKLLLISGSEVGQRVAQHANIINAANAAGVTFVAYTSILAAQTSPLALAEEHKATEDLLGESGVQYVLLRNGWYWENYVSAIGTAKATGALFGAAGTGSVAAAARKDYAEAAAAILTSDETQAGKIYELGGDERLTYPELAEVLSGIVGAPVAYKNLAEEEYSRVLEEAGVPAPFAKVLANSDAGIAVGALDTTSGDLQRLLGRPSTPVAEVLGG